MHLLLRIIQKKSSLVQNDVITVGVVQSVFSISGMSDWDGNGMAGGSRSEGMCLKVHFMAFFEGLVASSYFPFLRRKFRFGTRWQWPSYWDIALNYRHTADRGLKVRAKNEDACRIGWANRGLWLVR